MTLSRRSQFTRRFYISKNYDWITSGHLEDVLRFMGSVRTLEDCKRAWELQAEWLREHPEDEVVIDEGEALYMHEEALKYMEAQKQAVPPQAERAA